jgi:ubiquinone biosynthesis protein UbiJ
VKKITLPLNSENQAIFKSLIGKAIKIHVQGTGLILFLSIHSAEIVLSTTECETQLEMTGAPFTLLRILLRAKTEEAAWNNITLQGDVLFAESLSKAIRRAHFDWESSLANILGDYPAVQIVLLGKKTKEWSSQTARALLTNLSEYWQEEARYTPSRIETEAFIHAVDIIQEDTARLDARIQQLIKVAQS